MTATQQPFINHDHVIVSTPKMDDYLDCRLAIERLGFKLTPPQDRGQNWLFAILVDDWDRAEQIGLWFDQSRGEYGYAAVSVQP